MVYVRIAPGYGNPTLPPSYQDWAGERLTLTLLPSGDIVINDIRFSQSHDADISLDGA